MWSLTQRDASDASAFYIFSEGRFRVRRRRRRRRNTDQRERRAAAAPRTRWARRTVDGSSQACDAFIRVERVIVGAQ